MEFLKGNWQLECTPWGNPTYNVFGWQKPCYLLQEGYAASFDELMQTTEWSEYGRSSGNSKCTDCMVHCGYEPTAVMQTFGSLRTMLHVARVMFLGSPDSNAEWLEAETKASDTPPMRHSLPILDQPSQRVA